MHESYIRYGAEEKESIVLTVKRSELSIVQALKRLGIPRRTFYNWYKKYAIFKIKGWGWYYLSPR